jgi:hypothetical protein
MILFVIGLIVLKTLINTFRSENPEKVIRNAKN